MMWHDPNPKTKKVAIDKGTGAWGDPTSQGEIKRWKDTSDDVGPGAGTGQGATPLQPTSAGGGGSVWDKSPVAPQPTVANAVAAPPPRVSAPPPAPAPSSGWGETPTSAATSRPVPDWTNNTAVSSASVDSSWTTAAVTNKPVNGLWYYTASFGRILASRYREPDWFCPPVR